MKYYEIALNIDIATKFTYVSQGSQTLNRRCIVPFGNSIRTGIIVAEVDDFNPKIDYKEILEVIDQEDILPKDLWELSFWISGYYQCSLGKAMFSMLPKGISVEIQSEIRVKDEKGLQQNADFLFQEIKSGSWFELNDLKAKYKGQLTYQLLEEFEKKDYLEIKRVYDKKVKVKKANFVFLQEVAEIPKLTPKQQLAYTTLKDKEKIIPLSELAKEFSYSIIKVLQDKSLIKIIPLEVSDNIDLLPVRKDRKVVKLTEEQVSVITNIERNLEKYKVHLLYGITGSGKTEIYIRIMEKVLTLGKNALLLVPEISLTPQAVDRFYSAFGEKIAILHSHLSDRERLYEWKRIKNHECRIIIGARSAIFAPLENIGLIIVDEEHEGSYKQDNSPRYNARDLAVIRSKINHCPLILGSATPSLESWNNAINGKYELNTLLKRPEGIFLPKVNIIDMKKQKNDILISEELTNAIKANLERKEQTILFQNRRGYSTFLQCKNCGELVTCPNCDISLHYHSYTEEVVCHYCGYRKPTPRKCDKCGHYTFMYGAGGTQKLEEQIRALFPTAKILRMDSDTTSKKKSYTDMYEMMSDGSIDILIGTQMISKGLDFPNVTLVGVILADISLNLPDFRASERAFQLLTQVAGRAGRGDKVGEVYIQTYLPTHYAIKNSAEQDFLKMAEIELRMRYNLFYPPHFRLARILFSHANEVSLTKLFQKHQNFFDALVHNYSYQELKVLGPTPAPLVKINNKYRYHLIFKGKDVAVISSVLKSFREEFNKRTTVKIDIDVDPTSLL